MRVPRQWIFFYPALTQATASTDVRQGRRKEGGEVAAKFSESNGLAQASVTVSTSLRAKTAGGQTRRRTCSAVACWQQTLLYKYTHVHFKH